MLQLVLYLWNLLLRLACCFVEYLRSTAVDFLKAVLSTIKQEPRHSTAPLFFSPPDDFNPSSTEIAFTSIADAPNLDMMTEECRTRLRLLTEEAFPDGEIPKLCASSPLALSPKFPRPPRYIPFIRATRIIIEQWPPIEAFTEDRPQVVLENVCLWDTGSEASCIVTSKLTNVVRRNRDWGWATMKIACIWFSFWFSSPCSDYTLIGLMA